MQIVIDIPDAVWDKAKEYGHLDICGIELSERVINGTPLPKGHGNLIDVSDLTPDADYEDGIFGAVSCQQIVEAEVIIEADKTESEE